MVEKPVGDAPRGPLRALDYWVTGPPSPPPSPGRAAGLTAAVMPTRIGHYAIARKLGQGGMGVVYAARDERLDADR